MVLRGSCGFVRMCVCAYARGYQVCVFPPNREVSKKIARESAIANLHETAMIHEHFWGMVSKKVCPLCTLARLSASFSPRTRLMFGPAARRCKNATRLGSMAWPGLIGNLPDGRFCLFSFLEGRTNFLETTSLLQIRISLSARLTALVVHLTPVIFFI